MWYFTPNAELLAQSTTALASINTSRLLTSTASFNVYDPATEEVIVSLPDHNATHALEAVAKADAAGKAWAKPESPVDLGC